MMHGSLYLFSRHMGYHSTLPFGYTKNRIIPFKVRHCRTPSAVQVDA